MDDASNEWYFLSLPVCLIFKKKKNSIAKDNLRRRRLGAQSLPPPSQGREELGPKQ